MFAVLPASSKLAGLVGGYWFVEDIPGVNSDRPVRTSPVAGAVLTVNIGRPNAMEGGLVSPRVALTGIQTVGRSWRSWEDTYFVMAMLTLEGLTRLFPSTGANASDSLLDVGAVVGDGPTRVLAETVAAAWSPHRIALTLDGWLLSRLGHAKAPSEASSCAAAWGLLAAGGRVDVAAQRAQTTRRQLHRWTCLHAGVSPKQLADIGRLQASLAAFQTGQGDPLEGYSDQAHQIRSWRRRLGLTPGAYARQRPTPLADFFNTAAPDSAPVPFYL